MPKFQKNFIKKIAYHPDLPLTFNYVPKSASDVELVYSHFGLHKPKNGDYAKAMACLIAEGVLAALKDKDVSYSRRTNFYTGLQRYHGEHFTHKLVTSNLDEGTTKGLFVGRRAESGDHRRTGTQSTFRASPELVKLFDAAPFERVENEIIRLKGLDDRLIVYKDTPDTIRWRSELQAINRFLASIQITMPNRDIGLSSLIETETGPTFCGPVALHRVFNRGSFDCLGRAFGWHQNLPKLERKTMHLNGEPVVELDYSALHASMLYSERQLEMDFDPYTDIPYPREFRKRALNIAINCRNRVEANHAVADDLMLDYQEARVIVTLVLATNSAIRDAICSDAGIRLMRKDSDIILLVMRSLISEGIPCLPVHDSIIVPKKNKDFAEECMERAYSTFFPGFTCRIH